MKEQWVQSVMTIGIPTVTVLVGILINNSRMSDLRAYMDARFSGVDTRLNSLDSRMNGMETRMDILVGKVSEIDTRLSILEDRLAR